jgi:arabinogalactan oligomer/maltooligosaccharide transport system substrate-binding protein
MKEEQRMRKKLFALSMTVILAASMLAGCGKKEETTNPGNGAEATTAAEPTKAADSTAPTAVPDVTTEEITLKVWESTGGPDEFIKQAGAKFTEAYPNIKIEFINVELGDSTTQIALDGPAGVGPDLFAAPHDKLGELATGGHVLPTANADDVTGKVLGACSTALTYDGTMYGYPISAETYALFYNKALISEDKVPKTWEDLKAFSKDFNANNKDKYGFVMDVGNAYYTIIFTTSNNNRLFGPNGNDTTNTNINSPASVEGMKFFAGLRDVLDIPAADLTTSTVDGIFGSGNAALYITGLWNVTTFEGNGLDFGVAPLPSLPGNTDPVASFSGTRAMFVSAYSEHPTEAALFADFLLSEEMQLLRFELTGSLPSINVAVESPYIEGFLKQLDYAFPMPSIPQMNAYWEAMNAASANIWDGADIQAELDQCNTTILQQ